MARKLLYSRYMDDVTESLKVEDTKILANKRVVKDNAQIIASLSEEALEEIRNSDLYKICHMQTKKKAA